MLRRKEVNEVPVVPIGTERHEPILPILQVAHDG